MVANSKKVGHHFQRQSKPFFYAVIILENKLGKRSLTCYKGDTRMYDMQCSSSPKSKMASSYRLRCMCCILETNLTRKFAADLSVANLVTNFQDLVAKVKNLVVLVPVLGKISCPVIILRNFPTSWKCFEKCAPGMYKEQYF